MSKLQGLIERLQAADAPDLTLDAEIFLALDMPLPEHYANIRIGLKWDFAQEAFTYPLGDLQVRYNPPACTSSLDAALHLVELKLPGWGYFIRKDDDGCNAALLYPDAMRVTPGAATHSTQPIAVCIALLKALNTCPPQAGASDAE